MDRDETCGVITFFSSQHAVHAEKVLTTEGLAVKLIPGPKEISPNCGVAIRCDRARLTEAEAALRRNHVMYEAAHEYSLPVQKSIFDKWVGR